MSEHVTRFNIEQLETVRSMLTPKAYERARQYAQGVSLDSIARQDGVSIYAVMTHIRWAFQLIKKTKLRGCRKRFVAIV